MNRAIDFSKYQKNTVKYLFNLKNIKKKCNSTILWETQQSKILKKSALLTGTVLSDILRAWNFCLIFYLKFKMLDPFLGGRVKLQSGTSGCFVYYHYSFVLVQLKDSISTYLQCIVKLRWQNEINATRE